MSEKISIPELNECYSSLSQSLRQKALTYMVKQILLGELVYKDFDFEIISLDRIHTVKKEVLIDAISQTEETIDENAFENLWRFCEASQVPVVIKVYQDIYEKIEKSNKNLVFVTLKVKPHPFFDIPNIEETFERAFAKNSEQAQKDFAEFVDEMIFQRKVFDAGCGFSILLILKKFPNQECMKLSKKLVTKARTYDDKDRAYWFNAYARAAIEVTKKTGKLDKKGINDLFGKLTKKNFAIYEVLNLCFQFITYAANSKNDNVSAGEVVQIINLLEEYINICNSNAAGYFYRHFTTSTFRHLYKLATKGIAVSTIFDFCRQCCNNMFFGYPLKGYSEKHFRDGSGLADEDFLFILVNPDNDNLLRHRGYNDVSAWRTFNRLLLFWLILTPDNWLKLSVGRQERLLEQAEYYFEKKDIPSQLQQYWDNFKQARQHEKKLSRLLE